MQRTQSFAQFQKGADSALLSIQFPDRPSTTSAAYLLLEGVFFHAERTPNALCLRLPAIANEGHYFDVTYARAAEVLEHLLEALPKFFLEVGITLTRNSVVAVLTLPYAHSFFVNLALMRLGCVVQWFNHELGKDAMYSLLGHGEGGSRSVTLLYAGLSEAEIRLLDLEDLQHQIGVTPVELTPELYTIALAKNISVTKSRPPMSGENVVGIYHL